MPILPGAMILPEVTLPLNTMQVNTAYSLLRTLRSFCCENPGVLDTTSALVQLPPVGDERSPYQVPPPPPAWPVPQLPLRGLSLDGNLRDEQEEYAENVYIYHLINAATALVANASRKDVGRDHAAIQDISVGFGVDRQRLNVVCTEAPGVVIYTDPAMDDEGDMDSVLDGNYGVTLLDHNQREHYNDLNNRYRQRRDRTCQLVAQLSTLNTRNNLNPTEVCLPEKTLFKEDIRKYSKFETLATTICDQQDAVEAARRRYDEQVASSSAQLAQLTRSHEARMANELRKAKVHFDGANEQVQASEAKARLLLHEQTQRSEMVISELRQALTAITAQDVANTRAAAAMEVHMRKELLEARHRVAELEPAWETFIDQHNEDEEAQDLEQRRRTAVVAQPSERRHRRLENEANRVELRAVTRMQPPDASATPSRLATPRGADIDLSGARELGSASTLGMFSPAGSYGVESAREPGPSTATVDSDAACVAELDRGNQGRHVEKAHHENSGSFSLHLLRREELVPDSMRKTTIVNLETKTLKAFRNIFAHHKNAHAKISDWVSYIPVELHTQVRARIRSVVDPKTDEKQFTAAQVDSWQSMGVLTMLPLSMAIRWLWRLKISSWCPPSSLSRGTMRHWSTSCPRFIGNSCWSMKTAATRRAHRKFRPWNAPSRSRLRVSALTSSSARRTSTTSYHAVSAPT